MPGRVWACMIGNREALDRSETKRRSPSDGVLEVSTMLNTQMLLVGGLPRWYCNEKVIIVIYNSVFA